MRLGILRTSEAAAAAAMLICLIAASGCAVGPDFRPPPPQVPSKWVGPTSMPASQPATGPAVELARWWAAFGDPNLTSLVQRAMQSNLDLLQAQARLRQARATRGVAFASLGPVLDALGSYRRSSPAAGKGLRTINDQFQYGLDAVWELDIFGGSRRGLEAAQADLQAAQEDLRSVLVSLAAEVALNYIEVCGFQQRIEIARNNLKAQQHTAELTRQRFRGGFVSALDVANADALVATTASQIPLLESAARQAIYSLSVLLGHEPAALVDELSKLSRIPVAPPAVPVGLPSDLLRRRPDIRRSEALIHGATARIGVATADLFPRFTLTGSTGFQSDLLKSSLDWRNRFWSFGPAVDWRIFDTGRILSNIEVQKALQEQAVLSYRQTVLTALQEVENTLIASAKEEEHRRAVMEAVTANRKAVSLATDLYAQGQTDFLNVLQAQRALLAGEDELIQSNQAVSTNLVALYKALGGGWQEAEQAGRK